MDHPAVTGAASATAAAAATAGRRSRILVRRRLDFWLDFWLDAAILAGFTFAYSFGFTGLAVHEWLGLALGLILLVHLTLHWDWVIRTTKRLAVRWNWIVSVGRHLVTRDPARRSR